MAASGYTPIQLYYSTTPTNVPLAANLVAGELAINTADGKLYYKNVSGVVTQLAGLSGYSGGTGASGYSGFSGYSGSGISGYSGSGVSGYSGANGASGTSGYSGGAGASGFSGYSGAGVSGISGYSGATGNSGTSGFSGSNGASGFSGYSGAPGTGGSGSSGASGFSGFSGYSGATGTTGASGYSGFNGISGTSGYSGATGPTTYPGTGIAVSTGSAWGTSLPNPLQVSNGGTGLSAVTAGYVPYGSTSTLLGTSSLFNWTVGSSTPATVKLGIGIASPTGTLHIRGGDGNNLNVDNNGSTYTTVNWFTNGVAKSQAFYDASTIRFVLGTVIAAPVVFMANNDEGMRLSSGGGVSIGTSTGAGTNNLLVAGSVTASSYKTANFTIAESSGKLYFYYGATIVASLDSSGNFTTVGSHVAGGTP